MMTKEYCHHNNNNNNNNNTPSGNRTHDRWLIRPSL